MTLSVNIRSGDFVRVRAAMLENGLEMFGVDHAASAINGKQVPYTPPAYATACLRTLSNITSEAVRVFFARLDADVRDPSDFPRIGLTDWPHEYLLYVQEHFDELPMGHTRQVFVNTVDDLIAAGARANLQLVMPFVPAFGEDFKERKGNIYLGDQACASFWSSLTDIVIALGFVGDVEINATSFFEGKSLGDWLSDRLSAIAEGLGNAAAEIANTAGRVAGNAAKGLIGGLGLPGLAAVGVAGYIVVKKAGILT